MTEPNSSPALGHERLSRLMKRGTDFLGCEVAILGGAMSWISERNLVSALSNAGAFGVIACANLSPTRDNNEGHVKWGTA